LTAPGVADGMFSDVVVTMPEEIEGKVLGIQPVVDCTLELPTVMKSGSAAVLAEN